MLSDLTSDLIYYISFYLPILFLRLLSKRFLNLYDDNWYKKYMIFINADIDKSSTLAKDITYKELLYRYLYSGYLDFDGISMQKYNFINKHISKIYQIACSINPYVDIVLRYDGYLYLVNYTIEYLKLIDKNVVEINEKFYIKSYRLYYIDIELNQEVIKFNKTKLAVTTNKLTSILSKNDLIYAVTNNEIYKYNKDNKELTKSTPPQQIKKVILNNDNLFLLTNNHILYLLNNEKYTLIANDVEMIYGNFYKSLSDKYTLLVPCEENVAKFNNLILPLKIKGEIISSLSFNNENHITTNKHLIIINILTGKITYYKLDVPCKIYKNRFHTLFIINIINDFISH